MSTSTAVNTSWVTVENIVVEFDADNRPIGFKVLDNSDQSLCPWPCESRWRVCEPWHVERLANALFGDSTSLRAQHLF